jgi:hypothetical protein
VRIMPSRGKCGAGAYTHTHTHKAEHVSWNAALRSTGINAMMVEVIPAESDTKKVSLRCMRSLLMVVYFRWAGARCR